ncbi:hypothetical protein OH77DRAFT_1435598 [Trametes cingulata]|nr:hypothetical protein OH77DRAFT_1435598 [Trametes cingulata]
MNSTADSSDSQWGLEEEEIISLYVRLPAHSRCSSYGTSLATNYVNLIGLVIIVYDYLITLDCEVRTGWCRKFTWGKLVLLLNRYLSILLYLLSLVPLLPAEDLLTDVTLLYMVWAAFSGLRVYAISNHSRLAVWLVVSLALVPVAIDIYLETQMLVIFTADSGCTATIRISQETWTRLSVPARAGLAIAEALVAIVIWLKTWHAIRTASSTGNRFTFTQLVFKEGMECFVFILISNSLEVIVAVVAADDFSLSLAAQMGNTLVPVLISRFYFNLDNYQRQVRTPSTLLAPVSAVSSSADCRTPAVIWPKRSSTGLHSTAAPEYPNLTGPAVDSYSYHRGGTRVVSPTPTRSVPGKRPPVLDFSIKRGLDIARGLALRDDGTPRSLKYSGKSYPVPLPPNTDTWGWKVVTPQRSYASSGIPLSVFTHWGARTEEKLERIAAEYARPFAAPQNAQSGCEFLDRGVFPNEFRPATRPMEQIPQRTVTWARLLARLLEMQCDWYIDLIKREHTEWYTHKHEVWHVWAANPLPVCLWIVAIRRTLPDPQGRVFYFPQLELRPLA